MRCPDCKNKGFKPTDEVRKPIKPLNTYKYITTKKRLYVCNQCGCRFTTMERFEKLVQKGLAK